MNRFYKMTKIGLTAEANRRGLEFDKNITRPQLIGLLTKDDKGISEEISTDDLPIDVPQIPSLAGKYTLICDAMVNDGLHKMGTEIELDEDDARSLLKQGAIKISA